MEFRTFTLQDIRQYINRRLVNMNEKVGVTKINGTGDPPESVCANSLESPDLTVCYCWIFSALIFFTVSFCQCSCISAPRMLIRTSSNFCTHFTFEICSTYIFTVYLPVFTTYVSVILTRTFLRNPWSHAFAIPRAWIVFKMQ